MALLTTWKHLYSLYDAAVPAVFIISVIIKSKRKWKRQLFSDAAAQTKWCSKFGLICCQNMKIFSLHVVNSKKRCIYHVKCSLNITSCLSLHATELRGPLHVCVWTLWKQRSFVETLFTVYVPSEYPAVLLLNVDTRDTVVCQLKYN